MFITPFLHAVLSAAAVGLLLSALRRAGPRAAGLAAAVPINSTPVLFWLWLERGGGYAASAVLGSLYGTALTVLLGAIFGRAALTRHAALAALVAWMAVGCIVVVTWRLSAMPVAATVLAIGAIVLGHLAWPRLPARVEPVRRGERTSTLPSIATAGAMSLAVSALSNHSGPQLCGLVAALPLIGTFALHAGHRQGGTTLMLRVLGGYLDGMTAKAAFLATLGWSWALGAGGWAWLMALAAAGLALQRQTPGGPRTHPSLLTPSDADAATTSTAWTAIAIATKRAFSVLHHVSSPLQDAGRRDADSAAFSICQQTETCMHTNRHLPRMGIARHRRLLWLAPLMLALVGCGGGGSGDASVAAAQAQGASIPQPLVGQWETILTYVPPFYSGPYGDVPNGDGAIGITLVLTADGRYRHVWNLNSAYFGGNCFRTGGWDEFGTVGGNAPDFTFNPTKATYVQTDTCGVFKILDPAPVSPATHELTLEQDNTGWPLLRIHFPTGDVVLEKCRHCD